MIEQLITSILATITRETQELNIVAPLFIYKSKSDSSNLPHGHQRETGHRSGDSGGRSGGTHCRSL